MSADCVCCLCVGFCVVCDVCVYFAWVVACFMCGVCVVIYRICVLCFYVCLMCAAGQRHRGKSQLPAQFGSSTFRSNTQTHRRTRTHTRAHAYPMMCVECVACDMRVLPCLDLILPLLLPAVCDVCDVCACDMCL